MEELEHIFEQFLQKSKISARFPHGIVHPSRDWMVALAVALLFTLLLVGYSSVLFIRAEQGVSTSENLLRVSAPTINRSLLQENVEVFEEKGRMLEELRTQKPAIKQP